MKKLLTVFFAAILLTACGGETKNTETKDSSAVENTSEAADKKKEVAEPEPTKDTVKTGEAPKNEKVKVDTVAAPKEERLSE